MVKRLYLISTFAARHAKVAILTLQTWRQLKGATIAVMIEESEVSDVQRVMHETLRDDFEIIPYRYQNHSYPDGDIKSRKKSPLFSQIWEAMQAVGDSYDYLCFTNSDIEYYSPGQDCSIRKLLAPSEFAGTSLILGQRIDYMQDKARPMGTYLAGYDIFFIRSGFQGIKSSAFRRCRIGEVGWDYLIPLSQEKSDICCIDSTSTYHRMHKTGSISSWSSEIITVFQMVHESWYRNSWDKGIMRSLALALYMRFSAVIAWLPHAAHIHCKAWLEYMFARVFFYCFMKRELASIKRL